MIYFIGEVRPVGKRSVKPEPNGLVKIGFTAADSAAGRLENCQTGNPRKLAILKEIEGLASDERALHRVLAEWRLSGEWFAFSSHALRVLTWKRVQCAESFVAALGVRYEGAWQRGWSSTLEMWEADRRIREQVAVALPVAISRDDQDLQQSVIADDDVPPIGLREVLVPPPIAPAGSVALSLPDLAA